MLKIIKDIKTGKNFNKNRILLLFINLILIFKLQNACSCLTSSPHGRWSWGNFDCDNTDPSCDSCPIGCFQNYKKTMWDNCFVWDDVNIYYCISCPAFCDYCTSTTSCTTCSTGYTKTAAGNCISCSA